MKKLIFILFILPLFTFAQFYTWQGKLVTFNGKLTYVESGGGAFSPSDISGLSAWYDASGLVVDDSNSYGKVDASGYVEYWNDLSGNNNHTYQGILANRPQISGDSLVFDGTNDRLGVTFPTTINKPYTIIIVSKPYINKTQAALSSTNSSNYFDFQYMVNGSSIYNYFPNNIPYTSTIYLDNKINTFIDNGTTASVYENNILQNSGAGGTGRLDGILLGCWAGFSTFFNGHITETIIYDKVLSETERTNVYNYLANKWGL